MKILSLVCLFCSVMCTSVFAENTLMNVFVEPGNPRLSLPVEEVLESEISSKEIQEIIDHMYLVAGGERTNPAAKVMVGLAAPQIGVYKQIVLVDVGANAKRELGELKAFINPKIIWKSEETDKEREGCYSVDGRIFGVVDRPIKITFTAYDRDGNFLTEEISGFPARVFQHEVDHLHGIRFGDRVLQDGGCIHWVEEHMFPEYKKTWQEWSLHVPADVWLAMKNGQPYEHKN